MKENPHGKNGRPVQVVRFVFTSLKRGADAYSHMKIMGWSMLDSCQF